MTQQDTICIPKAVLKANFNQKGYFDRVSFHAQNCVSYKEAWEKTEEELEQYSLPPRYNCYQSFITTRSKFIRNQNAKKLGYCV